ncbi:MAG: acyl-CoA dehydrogenase family protein [Deltaproteobacteria bacterium]|nr:acyl-CoA dehydrogenase family protein [Deltaproteobacteria bacterium]MBW2378643.1 acyl-CoA dehydrogenase family protein [Deltaproteobacteria bacterium]MBW2626410.1 acyl-CoA dehydrogenase family protein [Deltaproteobacteria bacterium]
MDFELDQDQQMLAKTVGDFAKNESPVARFRQLRDTDIGYEPAAWRKMGELGWMGVPFAESVGGFGGSFVECALIIENLASTLVPEPYLASVVLGGMTLARAGNAAQHEAYLTPMIEGETTLALAYSEAQSRHDVSSVETTATPNGSGYKLSGEKVWVLNGHHADHLIVSAKAPGGVTLFVVPRDADGVNVMVAKTIDGQKAAFIRFEDVTVDGDSRLGEEGSGAAVLDRTMDYAAAAAVAEGVGITTTMLRMTVDYLGTREQFGVKIGSFQALQHRAVDMYAETELLRSISIASMVRADEDDTRTRRADISAAKYQLATGGIWVAQQSLQLHGGIGATDEHDIGLYFKRMYALNALFGDQEHHVARFASDPTFAEVAV